MAKDTEKLIRQLSLISYLMAERRPVTALEIRRDVEGYSGMNEDAFARRFYADRAELESLGIQLTVDRPADGVAEQENYSLRPENFHLPAIAFTDAELAALQTALSLLDGEFAYAEPLRLALQQITWGRPSPLNAPEQQGVALGITGSAGGHELSARLAKIETAIFRNKTITFDYYTMERDEVGPRKVDPYHLLFQGGQFYLLGHSHERGALRVFRLSRIRGKVAYATQGRARLQAARRTSTRASTPAARRGSSATPSAPPRCACRSASRGRSSATTAASARSWPDDGPVTFRTDYANLRQMASFVLPLGEHADGRGPRRAGRRGRRPDRAARSSATSTPFELAPQVRRTRAAEAPPGRGPRRRPQARDRHPARALRPARDAGVDPDRGRPRGPAARSPPTSASACRSPTPSCARTSTSSTS